MKHATWSILALLACLGLPIVGQVMGEPTISAVEDTTIGNAEEPLVPDEPETLFPPLIEEEKEGPKEDGVVPKKSPLELLLPNSKDQPAKKAAKKSDDSLLPQADEPVFQPSISLDGGTFGEYPVGPCCAVCGEGNSCPPNWYTQQEVKVLTRNKARRRDLTYQLFEAQQLTTLPDGSVDRISLGLSDTQLASTSSLGFDVSTGYSTTIGRYIGRDSDNRDHFIEFSFWGLHHWIASLRLDGYRLTTFDTGLTTTTTILVDIEEDPPVDPPNTEEQDVTLAVPLEFGSLTRPFLPREFGGDPHKDPTGGFNRADTHTMRYESNINSFELNNRIRPRTRADRLVLHPNGRWRRECQPGRYASWIFGFRVLSIDEAFEWHSRGVIQTFTYVPADPEPPETVPRDIGTFEPDQQFPISGDYWIRTRNDLVGLQIGGDYMMRRCKWNYGVRWKAGPFINFSDQQSRILINAVGDPFVPADRQVRDIPLAARKTGAALMFELGFVGTYKCRPDLMLRASYDFMWVSGLALAPEQLRFEDDPPSVVNDNGHLYYHGLSLGLEYIW